LVKTGKRTGFKIKTSADQIGTDRERNRKPIRTIEEIKDSFLGKEVSPSGGGRGGGGREVLLLSKNAGMG